MDSISILTKKHCHSATNIICGILMTVLAILAVIQAMFVMNIYCIINAVIVTALSICFWLQIAGIKIGAALLRIPLVIFTLCCFSIALLICSIGIIFLLNDGTENYIKIIFERYSYTPDFSTELVSIAIIIAGLILFALSFCLWAGVRFLGSVKRCLSGEIKRNGAKIFGISSIIISVVMTITLILYTLPLISSNQLDKMISLFPYEMLYIRIALVAILLFFMGISANSFANKTYAYKVFENQMMKVETNADGTVYVPINEEDEMTFGNPDLQAAISENKSSDKIDSTEKGRPYIKTGKLCVPKFDTPELNTSTAESNII